MTTLNKTTLTRKIALGLGAIVVSTMTLAGAAEAKKTNRPHTQGGGWTGVQMPWGPGYGSGCAKYKKLYFLTGKKKFMEQYMQCMGKVGVPY